MTRFPQAENAGMVAVGTALKEHASEIVQLWLSRAVADPRLPSKHRAELRDNLPQLLFRMGNDLAQGCGRQSTSTERAGEAHGHQRWKIGWNLDEVVRDFQTLRPVIEEVLRERLGGNLSHAAQRALDSLVDEAIVDSINSFTSYHQELSTESYQAAAVLAAIVNCSADAIISMSTSGEILSWNPAAEELYGYRPHEVIGRHAGFLYPDHRAGELETFLATSARGESLRQVDTVRLAKDGTPREVEITVSPVRSKWGEIVGCATMEQGISQRMQAATALRQAVAEAEQANRMKTEFLANVSHELRSPMNAIMGMTALSLDEELTPALRDNLLTIRDGAAQMLSLVDDLLDVSRFEAGMAEIEDEPFRLREVLDSTMRSAGVRASQKGLELVCHVAPGVPDRLRGDALRLKQILNNLIDNAVKFTEQGEVVVDVRHVGGDDKVCSLRCSVTDTGIGITPDNQSRVFAPFAQVDTSATRPFSGTGLGLTIACHLARSLGGHLELTSRPGFGSTFRFTAQFGKEDDSTGPHDADQTSALLDGLPVLVVDDNLTCRRTVGSLLESWGMRVVTSEGADQALAALGGAQDRHDPFQIVLVDALMPGVDGIQLAAKIAATPAPPRVILMASPADRVAMRERPELESCAGYVEKPLSEAKLRETILGMVVARKPDVNVKSEPPMTNPTAPVAPLHVLLVEDTAANRKVVERVLGKRGHRVTNAFNGREALELVRQEQFDVILMDVQMPIMDGFQAATAIRQWEADNQRRPTPIIAMTAHAMKTDRDRCYAAGMSGYIAKPMDIHQLAQTVENSARNQNGAPTAAPQEPQAPRFASADTDSEHRESIDLDQACKRLRGDRVLLEELMKCYRDDHEPLLDQIREALEQGEAKVAHRMAHNLKGLASNFDAVRTPYFAQQVELAAAAGDLEEARRNLPMLVESARELATLVQSAAQS